MSVAESPFSGMGGGGGVGVGLPINLNMCLGCSKEPSHSDGSFE